MTVPYARNAPLSVKARRGLGLIRVTSGSTPVINLLFPFPAKVIDLLTFSKATPFCPHHLALLLDSARCLRSNKVRRKQQGSITGRDSRRPAIYDRGAVAQSAGTSIKLRGSFQFRKRLLAIHRFYHPSLKRTSVTQDSSDDAGTWSLNTNKTCSRAQVSGVSAAERVTRHRTSRLVRLCRV